MKDAVILQVREGTTFIDGQVVFSGGWRELFDAVDVLTRSGKIATLVTPNVDQVINLTRDDEWRRAFAGASLRLCEGAPLRLLARALGAHPGPRITGAALLPVLAEVGAKRGWSLAVVGGPPGAARAAAAALSESTGARIVGLDVPILAGETDPAAQPVVSELRRVAPDIVFVCMGSPKQELWVEAWRHELPPALYCGVGAAVDFAAGRVRRAPGWVQRMGLEWLYRVVREPRRLWRRYFVKGWQIMPIAASSLWRGVRP